MSHTLASRPLGPHDEAQLRAFWAREPHANLFAIPDLDFLGWQDERLEFVGWFDGHTLVGYLMIYGISAQWSFADEQVAAGIAARLERSERPVEFVTGMERTTWPVLEQLTRGRVERYELSTVAKLPFGHFNANTLQSAGGEARLATVEELDALTAVHIAAPDQFNHLSYAARRRALKGAMTDGWRRVYLAANAEGHLVASAQTIAEGRDIGVIGGVVTHPAFRGQGFATLVTAALCQALLAEHKEPYLFYRRDNVPAARVYQKIGFVPLGDALLAQLEWEG